MSNNPTSTLIRAVVTTLCYAGNPRDEQLSCTRIDNHKGHCCDEVAEVAWEVRGRPANCRWGHDHSKEKKGLVSA